MLSSHLPHIKNGLRAAIAVGVAAWVASYFDMAYSYWVVLTVMVVMQQSVGATLYRAKLRILSTLFGVLLGAFLVTLIRDHAVIVMVVVLLLLFITLWMMIINYFYAIFFGSAALIILLGLHSNDVWLFVQERFFDTLAGVTIGLLFALLLWPNWAKKRLRQSILLALEQTGQLAELVLQGLTSTEKQHLKQINELKLELGQTLEGNQQAVTETNYEILFGGRHLEVLKAMLRNLERVRDVLFALHGMQCAGVNFAQQEQVKFFMQRHQRLVAEYFEFFIAELGQAESSSAKLPPLLLAHHELNNVGDHYSTLYLKRNLDRITYELMFFEQAISEL